MTDSVGRGLLPFTLPGIGVGDPLLSIFGCDRFRQFYAGVLNSQPSPILWWHVSTFPTVQVSQ